MTTSTPTLAQTIAASAGAARALIGVAEELHMAGGVRPDHAERFSTLRGGLAQLNELLDEATKTAEGAGPEQPDAAALDQLRHSVEALALTVDDLADQVRTLKPAEA